MFSGVEQGFFANFFGPVVDVNTLTIKLVRMIDAGKGGQLSEPAYARWIPWMGILPVSVQKLIRKFTGVDTAMLGFRGLAQRHEKANGKVGEKGMPLEITEIGMTTANGVTFRTLISFEKFYCPKYNKIDEILYHVYYTTLQTDSDLKVSWEIYYATARRLLGDLGFHVAALC